MDVALAAALFADIFAGDCDTAVLVTSDTDLRPALHVARDQGARLGVINPSRGRTAMVDRFGAFHVPPSWLPVPV